MHKMLLSTLLFGLLVTSCRARHRDDDHQHAKRKADEIGVDKLEEVFAWKQIAYNFEKSGTSNRYSSAPGDSSASGLVFPEEDAAPDQPAQANDAENSSDPSFYTKYNNVPMGVDIWGDRVFITVPRRREGVPATLNYVSLSQDRSRSKSPALRPYPSLEANRLSGTNPLVSVYRTRVDSCDRLWLVDIGVMEIPGNFRTIQKPALVIYDLKTDTLLQRYELQPDDLVDGTATGFASITVDVDKNDCSDAFAYIPDLATYGVVVYSLKENKSWRVSHNYFNFDPEEGDFNLNGLRYSWNDGVFSIALGARQPDGQRTVYFHAMASCRERAVSSAVLKNRTLATRFYHENDFKIVGYKGPATQTTMHAVSAKAGVMFGAQVGSNALSCWNMKKPLSPKTLGIIAKDADRFMYPSDLKIDNMNYIWIMTNRLPIFIYSNLNPEDVNFRLYRVKVSDAIKGTVCD